MPKLKSGDKVKIINNIGGHGYSIGSIVTIDHAAKWNEKEYKAKETTPLKSGGEHSWWIYEGEFIMVSMKPGVDCLFADEV